MIPFALAATPFAMRRDGSLTQPLMAHGSWLMAHLALNSWRFPMVVDLVADASPKILWLCACSEYPPSSCSIEAVMAVTRFDGI